MGLTYHECCKFDRKSFIRRKSGIAAMRYMYQSEDPIRKDFALPRWVENRTPKEISYR